MDLAFGRCHKRTQQSHLELACHSRHCYGAGRPGRQTLPCPNHASVVLPCDPPSRDKECAATLNTCRSITEANHRPEKVYVCKLSCSLVAFGIIIFDLVNTSLMTDLTIQHPVLAHGCPRATCSSASRRVRLCNGLCSWPSRLAFRHFDGGLGR
jgi:hypothetical protein